MYQIWFKIITKWDIYNNQTKIPNSWKGQKKKKKKKDPLNTNHSTLSSPASLELLVSPLQHFQPPTGLLPLMKASGWHKVGAREVTGGPKKNSSQRTKQLGTRHPSNHPAASLNL